MEGQRTLAAGRVLLIGAGGLGSPAALYLAAAGVGHIGIVDYDRVDLTNLQRQLLHDTSSVGERKTTSARRRIERLNPNVVVETYDTELTSANALEIIGDYDIVIDGSDNFKTRYLVNDACVLLGKPTIYGSVSRFEGQASVFATPDGPCYRCLFPEPPAPGSVQSCEDAGVLGVLPGLVGVIQATEAIKLLLDLGDSLAGRLLLIDTLGMRFRTVQVARDPACPACGTREIQGLIDYDAFCGGPAAVPGVTGVQEIDPRGLAAMLAGSAPPLLVDVREPYEWRIARIEGATLVPLSTFGDAAEALDPHRETVLSCHHGTRSRAAAEHLVDLGFRSVWNLTGGIARWSDDVDPRVPRY
jgi:adenylyltransferase/sulfurtransferase